MKKNFYKVILDIQSTLKSWTVRITIFKVLALSKVVYLAVLTVVSNHFINELRFKLASFRKHPNKNLA